MRKIFLINILLLSVTISFAENKADTLKHVQLREVTVRSHKETIRGQLPVSATVLTDDNLESLHINSIKSLSVNVPNFYVPDYGSALSTTAYIRGIGSRSSGQTIAFYVDNVPYFDNSTFDFNLFDIQQVEVLRGSQATLYGRNAMSGVVNIYTLSPFEYQGTKIAVTGGNYGLFQARATHYQKISDQLALSFGGYFNRWDGFLKNVYKGTRADNEWSAGGRFRLGWKINPEFTAEYNANFDYVKQSAFPYGKYDATTKKTADPNFNDSSSYERTMFTNSLLLKYQKKNWLLTSVSSYQYMEDDMLMDQDFTAAPLFTLEQAQKQHSLNEEIIARSLSKSNYQWSFGLSGFYFKNNMNAPVVFKKDWLATNLQPYFDQSEAHGGPVITIADDEMKVPGQYNTTTQGLAFYHQSTYNNFFVKGLSLTGGIRFDYEQTKLAYDTKTSLGILMSVHGMNIPITYNTDTITGKVKSTFKQVMPKLALKYQFNGQNYVYGNISRGYKAGGFNVQMFSDLVENNLSEVTQRNPPVEKNISEETINSITRYKPEYSWNYEAGVQSLFFNGHLKTSLSVYFISITDMQLVKFVSSGYGRMLTNAGEVSSKGFELSAQANLGRGFSVGGCWGFADAEFEKYTDTIPNTKTTVDYKGKHVPYAPQNTVSLVAGYEHAFEKAFIDRVYANAQYTGTGKIYWDAENSISQDYYSLVNVNAGIGKGAFELELWSKNLFDTGYNAFYFTSSGNKFFQKGKPLQIGATLRINL